MGDEAAKLAFAILIHPEISHRDARLLGMIHALQTQGRHVIHEELAEALDISVLSVARRLRLLRERGIVSNERVGSHQWWYTISLPDSIVDLDSPPDPPSGPSGPPGGQDSPTSDPTPDPTGTPSTASNTLTLIPGGKGKETEEKTEGAIESTLSQDPKMNDKLKKVVEEAKARGTKKPAPKRERFGVRKDHRREAFKTKEPSMYNVNDLELVYQAAWERSKRKGRPYRWTNKDRGQAKHLIQDQGPENAAKLIEYATEHWNALMQRYGVTGAPSLQAIYAYRRSWMGEALEGGPKKRKGFAEFSGDEEFEGGDTGWG